MDTVKHYMIKYPGMLDASTFEDPMMSKMSLMSCTFYWQVLRVQIPASTSNLHRQQEVDNPQSDHCLICCCPCKVFLDTLNVASLRRMGTTTSWPLTRSTRPRAATCCSCGSSGVQAGMEYRERGGKDVTQIRPARKLLSWQASDSMARHRSIKQQQH